MIYNKIRPTYDRLLVKRNSNELYKTLESGILIEETEGKEENGNATIQAVVVAQGPEIKENLLGATVILGRYSGLEVVKDSRHYLVNIKDVLGIYECNNI